MDEFTRAIASVLKARQEQPGQPSYTEIAGMTTLSRPTVERILNGKRPITTLYLRELCRVLQLDIATVIAEAEASLDSSQ